MNTKSSKLVPRIKENLGSFDKALNPATRAKGMAEVFSLFPELTEVSIFRKNFDFESLVTPGLIVGLSKATGKWEITKVYIPGRDEDEES